MVLRNDVINELNLEINENGIKVIGKLNDLHLGYITILENSNKNSN